MLRLEEEMEKARAKVRIYENEKLEYAFRQAPQANPVEVAIANSEKAVRITKWGRCCNS